MMRLKINDYGFVWGNSLIERTCSSEKNPKFQLMRVYAPNGEIIEILMRPRKNIVTIIPKEKKNV